MTELNILVIAMFWQNVDEDMDSYPIAAILYTIYLYLYLKKRLYPRKKCAKALHTQCNDNTNKG